MEETRSNHTYQNPVFIVGMPRSGTTLMQGILCNTGYYFPVPETHYFSRVACGLPDKPNQSEKEKICQFLKNKARIVIDDLSIDKLETQKEIFEYIIETFNKEKKDTFLEKTPRHVFFFSKIIKFYPSAKFICMIREPKNVVSSQISTTRIENKSIIRLSFLYNKISAAILSIKGKNNVFIVKYEELTNDPESILRMIFKFLKIPYNSTSIQNVAAPPEIVSTHEFWKNRNIDQQDILQNTAEKWKNVLTKREANIVNCITISHAEKLGYASTFNVASTLIGFIQDIKKLLSTRELKRLFSKFHG